MATFSIATATVSIATLEWKALDVNITTNTEAINLRPLDSAYEINFAGEEGWSGSFSVPYDDTTSTDTGTDNSANFKLILPSTRPTPVARAPVELILLIAKASGGEVRLTGNIVITGSSVTFNKTSVPVMEITFVGSGNLTQADT